VDQNRLYIADSSNAEYLDPTTSVWTPWASYPTALQSDACLTQWQGNFLLIDSANVQTYNIAAQTWTSNPISPSSSINNPSCLTLPNDKVLTVGSSGLPALYDPAINAWTPLPATINNGEGKVTLLELGKKFFIFAGNDVQEFNYHGNSWSAVTGGPTINSQWNGSGVAVPSALFANLPAGCTGGVH
jgi:hypothetical protein